MKKIFILSLILAMLLGCIQKEEESKYEITNPAAEYCRRMGYEYRIVTDADGSQRGECKKNEGVWVDEWTIYRNEASMVPTQEDQKERCEEAGGRWNDCGSRCAIDNQGKVGVACPALCESLCECGGIAGSSCPKGFYCKIPEGIVDALGYCEADISPPEETFCGWSTNSSCLTDADCITGGCSRQVCQSKNEEPAITTCEYRDCYNSIKYSLRCGCIQGVCKWA